MYQIISQVYRDACTRLIACVLVISGCIRSVTQLVPAPQNFGPLANSFGGFIPMVAGTEVGPVLANFQKVAALPDRLFRDPSSRLTVEFGDDWSRIMQGYVLGATDDETTKELLQEALMSGALALRFHRLATGRIARVATLTFIPSKELPIILTSELLPESLPPCFS